MNSFKLNSRFPRKLILQRVTCWLALCIALEHGTAKAHTWGDDDAPVVMMIFSAFGCNYCAELKRQVDQLKAKYPRDLKIVYKHFPLSNTTAEREPHLRAAAAAELGKFWEYHDFVFDSLDNTRLNKVEVLLNLAAKGIDEGKLNSIVTSGRPAERLRSDLATAEALKIRATPTIFLDGIRFEGLQDIATLERIVAYRVVQKPSQ